MKYKIGDKVRIKSIDWYNENKDAEDFVHCGNKVFDDYMSVFCGSVVTIGGVYPHNGYDIREDMQCRVWTDEMIECKMENEFKPKFKVGDRVFNKVTRKWVNIIEFDIETGLYIIRYDDGIQGRSLESEMIEGFVKEETKPNIIEEAKIYWDSIKDAWICPEGYIFKDENGNIINTTKIVLEKKKKEYPKTYEECCKVLGIDEYDLVQDYRVGKIRNIQSERIERLNILNKLLICRDAYWKIAGDEMELEKPWEPDWENPDHDSYPTITRCGGKIIKTTIYTHDCPFAFPTPEMRDAFKENFDPDIEICKELL